jgi:uncharacterized protein (DUF427 family)
MADRQIKVPDASHPIAIEANPGRVIVTAGGHIVADTRSGLVLREAAYPEVHYIPRADVDMSLLERTTHETYCPYKGVSSYYSIPAGGERSINAVWSYENPFPAMEQIRDHVAFYTDRVDGIEVV